MSSSAAVGQYDELLSTLAHQNGNIDALMDSFFEFLHRKTDFYVVAKDPASSGMGFRPGQAQERVLAAFHKYPFRDIDAKARLTPAAAARDVAIKRPAQKATVAAPVKPTLEPPRLIESGKQLPVGNGGRTDKYSWTQTLEDVSIQFELPAGTQSKDIVCQIQATHLRVALRHTTSSEPVFLVYGDLPEKIRVDESLWSLENNQTLHVSLEKIKQTWWASVVVGTDEIDTSQVDSTRHVHEYDEATQGAIRKAMFDQQQRQQGLPTTAEMETQRIIDDQAAALPGPPFQK